MNFFRKQGVKILLFGTLLMLIYKAIDNYGEILGMFKKITGILGPFIAGLIIAFFMSKPVNKVEELIRSSKSKLITKHARGVASIFVYVIAISVISFALTFLVPKLYVNAQDFVLNLPKYYNEIIDFINQNDFIKKVIAENNIEQNFFKILNMENVNRWFSIITGIANSFLSAFLSIVISIYLILEKDNIFSFLRLIKVKFFNNDKTDVLISYGRKIVNVLYSYIAGMAIDAVIMGVLIAIILKLFRIPYAELLGVVVAIGNMIPFFGSIISNIIITVIALITTGLSNAIWILVLSLVIGQIDANLVQPRILSNSTGISPLLVLLSVLIFGGFFGVPGMIIGVPLCAVLKMVVLDYLDNGKLDSSQNVK